MSFGLAVSELWMNISAHVLGPWIGSESAESIYDIIGLHDLASVIYIFTRIDDELWLRKAWNEDGLRSVAGTLLGTNYSSNSWEQHFFFEPESSANLPIMRIYNYFSLSISGLGCCTRQCPFFMGGAGNLKKRAPGCVSHSNLSRTSASPPQHYEVR